MTLLNFYLNISTRTLTKEGRFKALSKESRKAIQEAVTVNLSNQISGSTNIDKGRMNLRDIYSIK